MKTAIDIGNTNVKAGFFEKNGLSELLRFPSQPWSNFYQHLGSLETFGKCILSSVIPIPEHIIHYILNKSSNFIVLSSQTPLPFHNDYKSRVTLGSDRLSLVAGAMRYFPDQDIIIVNAGTCITYSLITSKHRFKGGAISPGLRMRLEALHKFTASLPLIDPAPEVELIGTTTERSILSGGVKGIVFEIEGYIAALQKKYKQIRIILSGGDARYLAEQLTLKPEILPDLALTGLIEILDFNVKKK